MQINIVGVDKKTTTIEIEKNSTILDIKKKISTEPDRIILIYLDEITDNNKSIQYYNINEFSNIYLIKKDPKLIKIYLDLSFYINKSIVLDVYDNITIKEIKEAVANYLNNKFSFYNFISADKIILLLDDQNIKLDNDRTLYNYNISNNTSLKILIRFWSIGTYLIF